MRYVQSGYDRVSNNNDRSYCNRDGLVFRHTVEPPNKGHVGDDINFYSCCVLYVLCREVVHFSEVQEVYREANFWELGLCPL